MSRVRWVILGVFLFAGIAVCFLLFPKNALVTEKNEKVSVRSANDRAVSILSLQGPQEEPFDFDRHSSKEWSFILEKRPALVRVEAEVNHSGFNAPLNVQLNGKEIGILRVNLPSLRTGSYQFYQAPRPGTADGYTFVADSTTWQVGYIFLERPWLVEGTNRLLFSSTWDRVGMRNLHLEILAEIPSEQSLDLRPAAEPLPFDSSSLTLPSLVSMQEGALKNFTPPHEVKFTALYFSAHWCGPCRVFTPELVEWYRQIRSLHKDFELVFVSADESGEAMRKYMLEAKMPWPAVPFDQVKSSGLDKWSAEGIPYLILFGPDGRPVSAKNREWRPPQEVMKETGELLSQGSSSKKTN